MLYFAPEPVFYSLIKFPALKSDFQLMDQILFLEPIQDVGRQIINRSLLRRYLLQEVLNFRVQREVFCDLLCFLNIRNKAFYGLDRRSAVNRFTNAVNKLLVWGYLSVR